MQIVDTRHGLPVQRHNDVPVAQARALGRTIRLGVEHDHARLLGQIVVAHQATMDGCSLRRDSYIAAPNAAITQEPAGYELGCINPDGKADSLGGQNGGGIHADHVSVGRHQRSARISRV